MSKPDLVFELFADANPVPAGSVIEPLRSEAELFLTELEQRGTEMADIKHTREAPDTNSVKRGLGVDRPGFLTGRSGWLVASAAFIGVLLVGAIWLLLAQRAGDVQPAGPTDDIRSDAETNAELWMTSLISGEVGTLLEITQAHQADIDDTNMYEFHAAFAEAGRPTQELLSCEADEPTGSMASVTCRIRLLDPVASEVGLDGDLVSPFLYTEGLLTWQPITGGDIDALNTAYRDYLRLYHPVEYDDACSPRAYEPGTVVNASGIALTRACAELEMSVSQAVVRWIRDGRPSP